MKKHFKIALVIWAVAAIVVFNWAFDSQIADENNDTPKSAWAESQELSPTTQGIYNLIGAVLIGGLCAATYYIASPDHPVWKRRNRKKHLKIALLISGIYALLLFALFAMSLPGSTPMIGSKIIFTSVAAGLTKGFILFFGYLITIAGYNPVWEGLKSIWQGGNKPSQNDPK